ncbi:MAG: c-type cytochrome domain-containing protein, partial [Rubripirellula sp.]
MSLLLLGSCWLTLASYAEESPHQTLSKYYCVACHSSDSAEGGLDLESIISQPIVQHRDTWERVVRKISAQQMPPQSADRPTQTEYKSALKHLTTVLDTAASAAPDPGLSPAFRRLSRT